MNYRTYLMGSASLATIATVLSLYGVRVEGPEPYGEEIVVTGQGQ